MVPPPGAAREDWQIVRALSEELNETLPYDDIKELRERMWDICPSLLRPSVRETTSPEILRAGLTHLSSISTPTPSSTAMRNPIKDFYRTDPISRASVTMAQCSKAFTHKDYTISDGEDSAELKQSYA